MPKRPNRISDIAPSSGGVIRSQLGDDPDMCELVDAFVRELPDRAKALSSAVREAEFEQVRRLAHQLKGACAGYGFPQIGRVAEGIEAQLNDRQAQTNQDVERLVKSINELTELCRRAIAR